MAGKKLYIVSGRRVRAGRHPWFGPVWFGGYGGFSNFVQTRCKRHADAQYRRLKPADRQMDICDKDGARALKWGAMR